MIIKEIIKKRANPPQKGSVTSHQDQLITFNNLSITKATPNKPVIPILDLVFNFKFFY